jgi:TRAP-type uncharacterized transport system substrate-binding protein
MVPGRILWLRKGRAAAALLLAGLISLPALAQTLPSAPLIKPAAPTRDENTVGIVAGGSEASVLPFVNDIATVLSRGQETGPNGELSLRVLPIVGRGGLHDLRDVLSLRGVDMGIIPEHMLARAKESQELGELSSKLVYITKLFNEELHIIARDEIRQLSDLAGKPVNFGGSGGSVEDITRNLFTALGLRVSEVHLEQDEALEEMRHGRLAATAVLAPKPAPFVERLRRDSGFHLISLPYPATPILPLPSMLEHEDYPALITAGERVETVAVGTFLIAYNWPEKNRRYRLLDTFVDAFFSRFYEFQATSRHPKWQEVNLAAAIPGWKRFKPAELWLQSAQARQTGSTSSTSQPDQIRRSPSERRDVETERLFEEFLQWRERQGRR